MNGTAEEPAAVAVPGADASAERDALLRHVISTLEENLVILESLHLTLAVALLDHAISEVRQQATN